MWKKSDNGSYKETASNFLGIYVSNTTSRNLPSDVGISGNDDDVGSVLTANSNKQTGGRGGKKAMADQAAQLLEGQIKINANSSQVGLLVNINTEFRAYLTYSKDNRNASGNYTDNAMVEATTATMNVNLKKLMREQITDFK